MKFLLHRLQVRNFKQLTDVCLHFPEKGAILIEGPNEAGKSTLFEAVYFALYGRALADGRAVTPLKQYDAEQMIVELDFSIAGRRFTVVRKLTAKKLTVNQRAELEYLDVDGVKQRANSLSDVNARILQEVQLSQSALLNTCFVAQKDLERLEGMDAGGRREAINELLNLRILTLLQGEFKVSESDRLDLRRQGIRVAVAQLDAELPALQSDEQRARRRWIYAQILDCGLKIAGWQKQVEEAKARQATVQRRRDEIARILRTALALGARLVAVETDLAHRAAAWQAAQASCNLLAGRVADLERLAAELPDEARRIESVRTLAGRLKTLEELEATTARDRKAASSLKQEIERYDTMLATWREVEEERKGQQLAVQTCKAALQEAEKRYQDRQEANLRRHQLDMLFQHGQAHANACEEASRLAQQLTAARQSVERLLPLRVRQGDLDLAEDRLRRREDDQSALIRTEKDLAIVLEAEESHRNRLAAIHELSMELQNREAATDQTRITAQEAAQRLRLIEIRIALTAWVEAAGRLAVIDVRTGNLGQLEQACEQARAALENARIRRTQAEKTLGVGLLLLVLGIVAGFAGFQTKLDLLIASAVVVALASGVPIVRSSKARRQAHDEENRAKEEGIALTGRMAEARKRQEEITREQEAHATREAERMRDLEALGEPAPISLQVARARIDELPTASRYEANEALHTAQAELNAAEATLEVLRHRLVEERRVIRDYDTEANTLRIAELASEQRRLADAVSADADLPDLLRRLNVEENMAAVQASTRACREEVARCEAEAGQVAELADLLEQKSAHSEREAREIAELASRLSLSGTSLALWIEAATAERERLDTEQRRLPDSMLETATEEAKERERSASHRLTAMETEQQGRREALNSQSREEMAAGLDALERSLREGAETQTQLEDVRPALQAVSLPVQTTDLLAQLAKIQAEIKHKQDEVDQLPGARSELLERDQALRAQVNGLITVWKRTLPDEAPPDSAEAATERLPMIGEAIRQERAALCEDERKREEEEFARETTAIGNRIATFDHQIGEARESRVALLQDLDIPQETPIETLPNGYPELEGVSGSEVPTCEDLLEQARNALQWNRAEREAQARLHGMDDALLDLQAEKSALATREKRMAVREQAGEILIRTREAIIKHVMPLTIHNMDRLLPLLTDGRYHQAQWNEEQNAIAVYDGQAHAYQRKSVFSGGARDQISLALRLAFAIATLPGEHSIRPGWLFLDEPLSSFDRQRTLALVELLTKGLIRREFDQIFLVSHSEAFDPGLFDHRIRMDQGRVVASTLSATLL